MVGEDTWGGEAEYLAVPGRQRGAGARRGGRRRAGLAAHRVHDRLADADRQGARVRPGETVLVMAGGLGRRRRRPSRSPGCWARTSSPRRPPTAKLAAVPRRWAPRPASTTRPTDVAEEVKRLTGGRGRRRGHRARGRRRPSPTAVRACAKGGRIVTCGATAGHEPALNLRHVFWRQLSILGSTMAPKGALHRILQLVGERQAARASSTGSCRWTEVAEAHRLLEARQVVGKLVLQPDLTPHSRQVGPGRNSGLDGLAARRTMTLTLT